MRNAPETGKGSKMELVQNSSQIFENISYLDRARLGGDRKPLGFIKRGTCFVVYGHKTPYEFAPSRFIGYRENTFEAHENNSNKDGRETNPAISRILGSQPSTDDDLEQQYCDFCRSLGFQPNATGAFGVDRKYWDMRK